MIIEKGERVYDVTESGSKWVVKTGNGKLSVVFDVSKELCKTEEALREYVLTESTF